MRLSQRKQSVLKPSRLKKDSEGVASVVGTILALIVFLSLLGIFTNHYVPSMMAANEHQHDNSVVSQISELKQSVDNMMMYSASSHATTLSSYNPVTLGSAGVPMFAVGTQGQMNVIPQSGDTIPFFSVSFNYQLSGAGGGVYHLASSSGGGVVVNIPNRYYIPQSVLYENDAVILGQGNGQVMIADPGFAISSHGGIRLNLLELSVSTTTTSNLSFSGTNTVALSSHLLSFSRNVYTPVYVSPSTVNVNVTVGTPFPDAWFSFFNSTFSQAGLTYGSNYTVSIQPAGSQLYILYLNVKGVSSLSLTNAIISVSPEE